MATSTTSEADRLLSIQETAELLGVSTSTMYGWRTRGKGPRSFRVGGLVKYKRSDIEAWLEDHAEDGR